MTRMIAPSRVWTVIAVLYAAFFYWYTPFGGPLTPEEIDHYLEVIRENGGDPERLSIWKRFMETDTGNDFAMLNVIDLYDTPLQVDGVAPGESSEEVMNRYARPFMAQAVRNAAHPVMFGRAAMEALDVWGIEGAQSWTTGALVRYRSRRDLMEQALSVGPTGIHDFKKAAMQKTIAFPLDPWFQLGDPRFVLALLLAVIGLSLNVLHLRGAGVPSAP